MQNNYRRWTPEEDEKLLNQVRVFPQNLKRCFILVAEDIDRSPSAVAAHWYSKLSKGYNNGLCFFTASSRHVSPNRKNGEGVSIRPTIWRRLLNAIRGLY